MTAENTKQTSCLDEAVLYTRNFLIISILKSNDMSKMQKKTEGIVKVIIILSNCFVIAEDNKWQRMFYLLIATDPHTPPFDELRLGQETFVSRNCAFKNCFVTDNPSLLLVNSLGAVLFNAKDFYKREIVFRIPHRRMSSHRYIFVSTESATHRPISHGHFNDYFNLTWTYRLDSDVPFPKIEVRNENDEVIGPKLYMHWKHEDDMSETSAYVKSKLRRKSKAAAWLASNCSTKSRREVFVSELNNELKQYGYQVDIYGACGNMVCYDEVCSALIQNDYYFYLAFEDSIDIDYVTDQLLVALQNFAVPIVYGGANYTRFMPKGSYINALLYGPKALASRMAKLIRRPRKYHNYFKWHEHYRFHHAGRNPDTDSYCQLCATLNHETEMNNIRIYSNFSHWWNLSIPLARLQYMNFKTVDPTSRLAFVRNFRKDTRIVKNNIRKNFTFLRPKYLRKSISKAADSESIKKESSEKRIDLLLMLKEIFSSWTISTVMSNIGMGLAP